MEKINALLKKWRTRTPKVRFQGTNEIKRDYNNKTEVALSKRIMILMGAVVVFAVILMVRLTYIQINQKELYETKLERYGVANYTKDAPRGEILDRNYKKLVENTNIITATYYAPRSISYDEIEVTANFLSKNVNINLDSLTLRQKKDYFIFAFKEEANKLVSEEERQELSQYENYTTTINNLILDRISEDMINEYMDHETMEVVHLTYLMQQCTSGSSVLIEDLTVKEASIIGQNASLLKGVQITSDWSRQKIYDSFSSVLGSVSTKKQGLPANLKDELLALDYENDARVGTSGLEQQYENLLRGIDNTYTLNYDNDGYPVISDQIIGESGNNLRLTIDWELQEYANKVIDQQLKKYNSSNKHFRRVFAILMEPDTGEILVMAGREIDKNTGKISDMASGNYTTVEAIGSTTKGGTLYTAFKNKVITTNTYFMDEPIKIKDTPAKASWMNLGSVNEVDALALSSNVYMFRIMMKLGNANYVRNGPLHIDPKVFEIYRRDVGELGLGVKTGLDVPNEQLGLRGTDTLGGYALDLSIGQYDTYTNIQLAQYISTLANHGIRVQPKLLKEAFKYDDEGNKIVTYENKTTILDDVSEQKEAFNRIQMGFVACVERSNGLCKTPWASKKYTVASKTGTAEIFDGKIDYPNRLNVGWAPKDNPRVVFTVICERQSKGEIGENSSNYIGGLIVDKYFEKYGL